VHVRVKWINVPLSSVISREDKSALLGVLKKQSLHQGSVVIEWAWNTHTHSTNTVTCPSPSVPEMVGCHWCMTIRATLFWSTSSRHYCVSTIGAGSPWDRKCNRYSTFLPPMCYAGTNRRKHHNCSCGTRTVEKLTQYRAGIGTVRPVGLSWRSVGTTTLFLRHQQLVSITEKCGTVKLLQANIVTNVGSITYLLTYFTYVLTYLLTPWSRVFLQKLTGSHSRNSPYFMEPQGSLPHSKVSDTCPYPEPARSSPYPHIPLPEDPSLYYPPIYAWISQAVSFPQVFPPKPYIRFSSSPYVLHSPLISFFSVLSPVKYWVRNTDH